MIKALHYTHFTLFDPCNTKLPPANNEKDLGLWFKLFAFNFLWLLCTFSASHPDEFVAIPRTSSRGCFSDEAIWLGIGARIQKLRLPFTINLCLPIRQNHSEIYSASTAKLVLKSKILLYKSCSLFH